MQHNARQRILLGLVTIGVFANTDTAEQAKQEKLAKEAAKGQKQEAISKQKQHQHQQPNKAKSYAPVHKHRQTAQRMKRY